MRALAAFVVAPLPPLVLFLVYETYPHVYQPYFAEAWGNGRLAFWCLVVAYGLLLAAGLPAFLLLKRYRHLDFGHVAAAAAGIVASIPLALEAHRMATVDPEMEVSYYSEGCQIVLENVRTACGYKLLFLDLVTFGVLGLIAAITFWTIYRRGMAPTEPPPETPPE